MKIIELLNLISKGEEVHKKIKYCDEIFIFTGYDSKSKNYTNEFEDLFEVLDGSILNDEIEIIEEKEMCHKCHKYPAEYNQTYCEFCLGISKEHKIPEKIEYHQVRKNEVEVDYIEDGIVKHFCLNKKQRYFADKINEILNYLEANNE